MEKAFFEWDDDKDLANQRKHGVAFDQAQEAFYDSQRVVAQDTAHGESEIRYYCLGKVADRVMTVRFTYRAGKIRIFGAGFWRKGRKAYEKANKIH